MSEKGERANIGRQDIPGIFFVTDENLNDRKASWGGKGRVRKKKGWTGEKGVPLCVKIERIR